MASNVKHSAHGTLLYLLNIIDANPFDSIRHIAC